MQRAARLFLAFILVFSVFGVTPINFATCHGANGAATSLTGC